MHLKLYVSLHMEVRTEDGGKGREGKAGRMGEWYERGRRGGDLLQTLPPESLHRQYIRQKEVEEGGVKKNEGRWNRGYKEREKEDGKGAAQLLSSKPPRPNRERT